MENQFTYRVFFMYLDLAHLGALNGIHPLWSGTGTNLAYFNREDHMGNPKIPLDQAIRNHVANQTGQRPEGPIRLLAHLRYFGYCFNPASFYYCYDADDQKVKTIIVQIHNTPWGQEHLYVLPQYQSVHPATNWRRHHLQKDFHVSPFMDMDIDYDWRFRVPGQTLSVHMINYQKGQRLFDASLNLERKSITSKKLTRVLLNYPIMTARVIGLVYWQALKLTLKGAPFFTHPAKSK